MLSCKFCEISKNTFSFRTHLVAICDSENPCSKKINHGKKHIKIDASFGETLIDVRKQNINRSIIEQLNINEENNFNFLNLRLVSTKT